MLSLGMISCCFGGIVLHFIGRTQWDKLVTMTARQQHGFTFENILTDNLPWYMHNNAYTGQHDGMFMHIPCSVKCMGMRGDICLSSFCRIVTDDSPSLMFLGIRNKASHVVMMHTLYFPDGTRGLFHPYENEADALVGAFSDYLHKEVLNSRSYDRQWQLYLNKFKNVFPVKANCLKRKNTRHIVLGAFSFMAVME